ncbi:MAG: ABC transporter ATP-binding protein [Oscillospiraceae bacterium]|jgi:lipopolysaccharide transport system ATP-binding protein|nr:ABC transporter ATP-binding protein [Oscillospiraceae bacterium]
MDDAAPYALRVEGVSKKYIIKTELKHPKLKEYEDRSVYGRMAQKFYGKLRTQKKDFWALQDINIDIRKGECVGIIGKNGAGKSTLLKLLSRITEPTAGRISVWGSLAAMLEVGTGFNAELTGRENVYLNGAILGMNRAQVDERFQEILDFSEIGQFIDTPVKRYSSGMYVRLGFAVAATLNPDIMIIDEVLAVGDAAFRKKCEDRMERITNQGNTVLLVSHAMANIRRLCSRCIVLEHGRIIFDGNPEEAIRIYEGESKVLPVRADVSGASRWGGLKGTAEIRVKSFELLGADDKNAIPIGEKLRVKFSAESQVPLPDVCFQLQIWGQGITASAPTAAVRNAFPTAGEYSYTLTQEVESLRPGWYELGVVIHKTTQDGKPGTVIDGVRGAVGFRILETDTAGKVPFRPKEWGVVTLPAAVVDKY